jgi:hypothetical protein
MGRRLQVLRDLRFVVDPPNPKIGVCSAGEVVTEIAIEQVVRDHGEFVRILSGRGARHGARPAVAGRAARALFLWAGHPRTAEFGSEIGLADQRRQS